jgi:FkbM family methyltransferase
MTYEQAAGLWKTPRGAEAVFEYRQDTIDWNVITSTLTEDEYGLAALVLEGWAFDIGAYIGSVAIALALDNPRLCVLAVEPVPDNVRLCRANVTRNGLSERVTVLDGAVGPPGATGLRVSYGYEGGELARYHAFVANTATSGQSAAPHEERRVVAYSLSSLVALAGGVPTFVKMDCEGGEWDLLSDPMTAQLPRIHGEWHAAQGRVRADLEAVLAPTHDLTFTGPLAGPGGFFAVLR